VGVRPLNGLVSIAEYGSRFQADTAVAVLAASGIDAVVAADPAHAAPNVGAERGFSVLVRIAIADDAQQALVRGAAATAGAEPEPPAVVHPSLLGRVEDPMASPPFDADAALDDGPPVRPRWMVAVAWFLVGSVVLPLVLTLVRFL
jgi:hypothetical protein